MAGPNLGRLEKGAIGTSIAAAGAEAVVGLDRAVQAAGDVLRGIFGSLPWETGGAVVAYLPEVLL